VTAQVARSSKQAQVVFFTAGRDGLLVPLGNEGPATGGLGTSSAAPQFPGHR
jgi:phosphoribosylamine-glycine ligase